MSRAPHPESGNVIFIILLAIVLIGLVTAAIRSGGGGSEDVDREAVTLDASKIKQYASELERGIAFIMNNGASEADIRFAYADASSDYGNIAATPQFQMFSTQGGGAEYRTPPPAANDGSPWEFYGNTALPNAGTDKADLIAVLPKVTAAICAQLNQMDSYPASTQPSDPAVCINSGAAARFIGTYNDGAANTVDGATFPAGKPILDGCVVCGDGTYNYFHALHVR
jgi:hypothetical protein